MQLPQQVQEFNFGSEKLQLCVPDETAVREKYEKEKNNGQAPAFPYWAKLWPASVALCNYLHSHSGLIKDKLVLELAAGLGLPSLLAARYARQVICSDHAADALEVIAASARLNQAYNIDCRLIDWQHYPADLHADVVLLSDVNYDPGQFQILNQLLVSLLQKGTIVVLSTPQRIAGKAFIEKLLPYCKEKITGHVETAGDSAEIFIMQLEISN